MNSPGVRSPGAIRRGISRIILDGDENGETIPPKKTWGRLEVVCFSANYCIGTGFLTLPHAMLQAGYILGSFVVLFTALISNMAIQCLLESMARAVPLLALQNRSLHIKETSTLDKRDILYGSVGLTDSEEDSGMFIDDNDSNSTSKNKLDMNKKHHGKLVVGEDRIELPALCELYLGIQGKNAFTIIISFYITATLWSFAVIVGQTFSKALPLNNDFSEESIKISYWCYLAVYGVFVTSLATQDMAGQFMTIVNLAFSVGRVFTVLLMGITLTVAIYGAIGNDDDGVFFPDDEALMVDYSGVLIALPISLFAMIFHHSVPTLSEPAIRKEELGNYFQSTSFIVIVAYLIISVPAVIYFGSEVENCVSLNWVTYRPSYYPPLAYVLRNWIIFFPPFSLLSSYPLMCITLSNNIMSFGVPLPETAVRLLAAVPPLLFAALGTDLTTVAAIGGVLGFLISLIFPVLLQRASLAAMETQFGKGSADTVYSSFLTRSPFAVASLGVLGLFLLAASFSRIAYTFAKPFWDEPDTNPVWG